MDRRESQHCRPSLECPLYPNCYEDTHHKLPRRVGSFALEAFSRGEITERHLELVRRVIKHPMNLVVGCRWVHASELDGLTRDDIPEEVDCQHWLDEAA